MSYSYQPALAHVLWPGKSASSQFLRTAILAVGGAVVLTASSKVQIPFYPVPQTLQTMFVLLIGMAYGAKLGAATMALYLAAGAMGMPVFAGTPEKGLGLAYMLGPTGGYLLGFVIAAAACGALAQRGWDRQLWRVAMVMLVGNVIIYACGVSWLGAVIGWDKPVLQFGMMNFLLGDALKIAFAAAAVPPAARAIRRLNS